MKLFRDKYPIEDNAEYVVDYFYDGEGNANYYYQLIRLKDEAILCSDRDVKEIMLHCWQVGIAHNKVAFI